MLTDVYIYFICHFWGDCKQKTHWDYSAKIGSFARTIESKIRLIGRKMQKKQNKNKQRQKRARGTEAKKGWELNDFAVY